MNSDTSFTAFGRYLKSMRIQMEIPVEAVANEIRISPRQLMLIEAEDHEQLPDAIYVKGILRAYATCIGVDADDIVERYLINRSIHKKKSSPATFFKYNANFFYRLCLPAGLFIIFIVISTYMVYGSLSNPLNNTDKDHTRPVNIGASAAEEKTSDARVVANQSDHFANQTNQPDKLFLQIDAVEDTDLKIIIDDTEHLKYTLHPMDHMELEASSRINLLVSNATGVKILLNGKPVTIPGKSGEFVNIELPQSK